MPSTSINTATTGSLAADKVARLQAFIESVCVIGIQKSKRQLMFTPQKWFLTLRTVFLVALASLGFSLYAKEHKLENPPIITPINLGREGIAAQFDIEVKEHFIYHFSIRFRYPEENEKERSRIKNIIGGHELDKNNNATHPGIKTPVKFIIINNQETTVVYKKTITPILTSWGSDSFSKGNGSFTKKIGHCDLKPGKYRIFLENISHNKYYLSIQTYLLIGMDKFKPSFDPKKIDRSKTCPQ
jgi:Domain of unknown function (DUF5625)